MNILMVCTGNICRSPMAEEIARQILREQGISDVRVDSAGTHDYHPNSPPDPRARAVMQAHGMPIDHLRARAFRDVDFEQFNLILVADSINMHALTQRAGDEHQRAKLARMLDTLPENPGMDLPDPYYGGDDDFEKTFQLLNEAFRNRFITNL